MGVLKEGIRGRKKDIALAKGDERGSGRGRQTGNGETDEGNNSGE